jgi:hypothetical protein
LQRTAKIEAWKSRRFFGKDGDFMGFLQHRCSWPFAAEVPGISPGPEMARRSSHKLKGTCSQVHAAKPQECSDAPGSQPGHPEQLTDLTAGLLLHPLKNREDLFKKSHPTW